MLLYLQVAAVPLFFILVTGAFIVILFVLKPLLEHLADARLPQPEKQEDDGNPFRKRPGD